jgi:hypothetical protein
MIPVFEHHQLLAHKLPFSGFFRGYSDPGLTSGLTRQVVSKRENLPHQADFEAKERETGLEPATTCLEGRDSAN